MGYIARFFNIFQRIMFACVLCTSVLWGQNTFAQTFSFCESGMDPYDIYSAIEEDYNNYGNIYPFSAWSHEVDDAGGDEMSFFYEYEYYGTDYHESFSYAIDEGYIDTAYYESEYPDFYDNYITPYLDSEPGQWGVSFYDANLDENVYLSGSAMCTHVYGSAGENSEDYGITEYLDADYENGDRNNGDTCVCKRNKPGQSSPWVFIDEGYLGDWGGSCYDSCATTCAMYFAGYDFFGDERLQYNPILTAGICEDEELEEPVTVTVTLYQNESSNDNTVNATVSATTGSSMPSTNTSGATLTAPTRSGYIFTGYWSARSGGTKYYNADMTSARSWNKNADSVLYAQWKRINTITLYQNESDNDNTVNATVSATTGSSMPSANTSGTTLTAPTRSGYIFNGYWSARSGGTKYYNANMTSAHVWDSDSDGVLYAQWIALSGYKFAITTTNMTGTNQKFKWSMSATGTFTVDCGDGGTLSGTGVSGNTITRTNTTMAQYTCTYPTGGVHNIRMSGTATRYNAAASEYGYYSAIGFSTENMSGNTPTKIAAIYGSLGAIFPTLNDGSSDLYYQPRFQSTFYKCTNLTSLPSDLFKGISGAANYMFWGTFRNCSGLTSLPSDLFKGISGAADRMFRETYRDCTNLTTVPYNLFAGASGTPGYSMFSGTFYNDTNLQYFAYPDGTTVSYIPPEFFGSISGYSSAMDYIFYNNTKIASSCPVNTYQNITGYESQWNGRVSCIVCPNGQTSPAGSTDVSQCVVASQDINCIAGQYLDTDENECAICSINHYCPGGNYNASNADTGIIDCPSAHPYAPTGMWLQSQCGRKLHVGEDILYMHQSPAHPTIHRLYIGHPNGIYSANAVPRDMTPGATFPKVSAGATHGFHAMIKDIVNGVEVEREYLFCDDSVPECRNIQ